MSSIRRLFGYEAVAAARAAMNEAKAAHEAVHRIDACIEVVGDDREAIPGGAEELLAELGARWSAYDRAGEGAVARLKAIREGLLPAALADHDREHALERLLFDQYHALLDDAEWADVKAVLEPLYAERTGMFHTLADAYHAITLRRAGAAHIASMRALCRMPGAENFINFTVAAATAQAITEAMSDTLPSFGIASSPPPPPAEAPDEVAYLDYLAQLDAWIADEAELTAAIGADVDRQMARWNEINRLIEQHTG